MFTLTRRSTISSVFAALMCCGHRMMVQRRWRTTSCSSARPSWVEPSSARRPLQGSGGTMAAHDQAFRWVIVRQPIGSDHRHVRQGLGADRQSDRAGRMDQHRPTFALQIRKRGQPFTSAAWIEATVKSFTSHTSTQFGGYDFFFQRAAAARLAISLLLFLLSMAARALPPISPPSLPKATAAGFLPSSGRSWGVDSPFASSTMALASWLMSRGRF